MLHMIQFFQPRKTSDVFGGGKATDIENAGDGKKKRRKKRNSGPNTGRKEKKSRSNKGISVKTALLLSHVIF